MYSHAEIRFAPGGIATARSGHHFNSRHPLTRFSVPPRASVRESVPDDARGGDVARPATLPLRRYGPESVLRDPGKLLGDLCSGVWSGRSLAWRLFVRDLKAQYRQTYLGYVWAVLPPLVAASMFIFLQSQGVTSIDTGDLPYPAFALMGTLLWQTFADALASPIRALRTSTSMLTKINFPREAIFMSGLLTVTFNLVIRLGLLAIVMAVWGVVPGPAVVLFPLALIGLLALGSAFGLLLLPPGGLYQDFERVLPLATQLWMLLTPVVYPARSTGWLGVLAVWNPVSPLLTTARQTLTGEALTQVSAAMMLTVAALAALMVAAILNRIAMPHLIERMGG